MGAEQHSSDEGPHWVGHESPPLQTKRDAEVRAWLVVSDSGLSYVAELGKHAMKRRTGLPARALRVLDPMMSQPTAVVGRQRAIAVNLEGIRAVITPAEVLILHAKDPLVAPFAEELQMRVAEFYKMQNLVPEITDSTREVTEKLQQGSSSIPATVGTFRQFEISSGSSEQSDEIKCDNPRSSSRVSKTLASDSIPFEFRALEVCLEYVCRCLEQEATTLEQEAYITLEELISKINTLNLEHVRQIKSRLSSVNSHVEKVKDELQRILDSDLDMAEMCLTVKLVHQQQEGDSDDESESDVSELEAERKENSNSRERGDEPVDHYKPDVQKLEMLLETYLTETKGTLNKLSTLRDCIDGTEDYLKIMLGDKQNQLLELKLVVSTAILLVHMGVLTVGAFAINVHIGFYNSGVPTFIWVASGVGGSIVVLLLLAVLFYKRSGVLSL